MLQGCTCAAEVHLCSAKPSAVLLCCTWLARRAEKLLMPDWLQLHWMRAARTDKGVSAVGQVRWPAAGSAGPHWALLHVPGTTLKGS